MVSATLGIANAIITESALSFLGLGFPPDFPTWGRLLFDGANFISMTPARVLWPGLAISLTVLSRQLHRRRPARCAGSAVAGHLTVAFHGGFPPRCLAVNTDRVGDGLVPSVAKEAGTSGLGRLQGSPLRLRSSIDQSVADLAADLAQPGFPKAECGLLAEPAG